MCHFRPYFSCAIIVCVMFECAFCVRAVSSRDFVVERRFKAHLMRLESTFNGTNTTKCLTNKPRMYKPGLEHNSLNCSLT